MKIHGLQKMTLLDYPGKVACTVFFGGCDMRCPFCHNAELLDSALTRHGIPHQYEHYRTGGHGFGVSEEKTTREAIGWKERFLVWLKSIINS